MASSQPFSAVLRLRDVAVSQPDLESGLGSNVERYQRSRNGSSHHAQLDIPIEKDAWKAVTDFAEKLGPRISLLKQRHLIGSATIDLAFSFDKQSAAVFVNLPSKTTATAGKYGIDLEFSIYPTNDGELAGSNESASD